MYTDSTGTLVCGNFIYRRRLCIQIPLVLQCVVTLYTGDDYVYRFHWYSSLW